MKYKKTILLIIIFTLLTSIICGTIYVSSQTFDYDNDKPLSKAYDNRYSKKKIDKLEKEIFFSNVYIDYSFGEFNFEYKPDCIRKTPFGYYAVLIHEDDSLCFVFWNFENKIYSIYRTNGFVSSDDFEKSILIGETTIDEMEKSGFDFFVYPYSKKIATAHICTDGILKVEYDDNRIAKKLEFFSNEELMKTDEVFLKLVPYILPEDKVEETYTFE